MEYVKKYGTKVRFFRNDVIKIVEGGFKMEDMDMARDNMYNSKMLCTLNGIKGKDCENGGYIEAEVDLDEFLFYIDSYEGMEPYNESILSDGEIYFRHNASDEVKNAILLISGYIITYGKSKGVALDTIEKFFHLGNDFYNWLDGKFSFEIFRNSRMVKMGGRVRPKTTELLKYNGFANRRKL